MLDSLQLGSIQARRMQSQSAYIIQEEMPQCVRPSFAKVALRAVVLACRHDARAPVVHEVTDHAVRGYCIVMIICSNNGSVVKSHLRACNIHTGHSLQTARQRKVYWPAVRVPKGQPNLATTGRPFLSHATTPQRRTASRAEIPGKA
jgi:hypothetical protein